MTLEISIVLCERRREIRKRERERDRKSIPATRFELNGWNRALKMCNRARSERVLSFLWSGSRIPKRKWVVTKGLEREKVEGKRESARNELGNRKYYVARVSAALCRASIARFVPAVMKNSLQYTHDLICTFDPRVFFFFFFFL